MTTENNNAQPVKEAAPCREPQQLSDEQLAAVAVALATWQEYSYATDRGRIVAAALAGFTSDDRDGNIAPLFTDDEKAKTEFSKQLIPLFPKEWVERVKGLRLTHQASLFSAVAAYRALKPHLQGEALLVLRGEREKSTWASIRAIAALIHSRSLKKRFYHLIREIAKVEKA